MNRRRRTGLVFIALLLTAVPGAPRALAVGEQFEGYQTNATGSAYTVFPSLPTLIPYDASVEATVALTQATLSTGGSGFGKASTFWPGVFAGIGPLAKLLCAECPPLPDYPIVVESREFEDPKQSEHPGLSMKTEASAGKATAEAVAAELGTPGVFTIGSAKTVSTSALEGDTLKAVSTATISGVEFAASQIKIDSIQTVSEAATDMKTPTCAGSAKVSGLTIAGQKAVVDKDGVRAADDGEPLVPGVDPNQAILAALDASGVKMRVVDGTEKCDSAAEVSRSSGGLLIQLPIPSPGAGIPPGSTMNVLLGSTAASSAAAPASTFEEPEFVPGDTGAVPPGTPILEESVARVPGPTAGGGFAEPVDTASPTPPPTTPTGESVVPFDGEETSDAYEFDGVPGGLVAALMLAGVIGVRIICRFMERLFTMGAVR